MAGKATVTLALRVDPDLDVRFRQKAQTLGLSLTQAGALALEHFIRWEATKGR